MRKILISLFLVLSLFIKTEAQSLYVPGYIITHEFDTLHGLIDSRGEIRSSLICQFKFNESSEIADYLPGEIFAYKFVDDKFYISKEVLVNEIITPLFLEYIVDGIADLYYYREINGVHYFIENEGIPMTELKNEQKFYLIDGKKEISRMSNRYIGVLRAVLADCLEVQPEIDRVKFTHEELAGLVEDYHNYVCLDGQECISYLKDMPPLIVNFGISLGYNFSKLNYLSYNWLNEGVYSSFDISTNAYPVFGIKLEFSTERISKVLSLQTDIELYQIKHTGTSTETIVAMTEYNEMYKNSLLGLVSLSLNYTFPRGKLRPYGALGAGGSFTLKDDAMRSYRSEVSGIIQSEEEYDDVPTKTANIMFRGQAGVKFYTAGSITPFAGLRFDYQGGSYPETATTYFYNQRLISVGFTTGVIF